MRARKSLSRGASLDSPCSIEQRPARTELVRSASNGWSCERCWRILIRGPPLLTISNNNHSLRAAIIGANNSSGDDVITLQKGVYNLSITNSNGQENAAQEGDLDLTQSGRKVTIQGAGAGKSIIDAACIDRVFQIFRWRDGHLQKSHHPQRQGAGRRHRRRATR